MFALFANALPVSLRRIGQTALACSVLALAACGGGGDRVKDYQPDAVVSFGDESSAFTTVTVANTSGGTQDVSGMVYAVNPSVFLSDSIQFCSDLDLTTLCGSELDKVTQYVVSSGPNFLYQAAANVIDGQTVLTRVDLGSGEVDGTPTSGLKRQVNQTFDCTAESIWIQRVAHVFGKGYQDVCSSDLDDAVSYAQAGAKAADLAAQIEAAKTADQLKEGVLVTLWLGQNDLYEVFDDAGVSNKEAAVRQRASVVIDGVKEILATGAKVLLVNVPNLAYSPYALAKGSQTCTEETNRPCNKQMNDLVSAFNSQLISSLGTEYALQGRNLGFIDAAEISNSYSRSSSYENRAVCAQDLLEPNATLACNPYNVITGADLTRDLWVDTKRVGVTLHRYVSEYALTRAAEQF